MNVKTLCLGVLELGEASGYEIRKMTQEGKFSHFVDASFGSIYPALAALEVEGMVSSREERHRGRPDRRVYAITERGRQTLIAALSGEPREDVVKSELLFVLRFADLAAPSHVRCEIDRRIAWLEGQIVKLNEAHATMGVGASAFACGYGIAVYEAMLNYIVTNRQMVEAVSGNALIGRDAAE